MFRRSWQVQRVVGGIDRFREPSEKGKHKIAVQLMTDWMIDSIKHRDLAPGL